MKKILLILIFFPIVIFSQVKVLENFDFVNNDYKLVFINQRKNNPYLLSNAAENFTISDKQKLLKLQNTWIGEESDEILNCGYDYEIYIVDKDSIIDQLSVNIGCGTVVASKMLKSINFKDNPFKNLTKDKKIFTIGLSADNITKARILYDKILSTKDVYFPNKNYNDWLNYEGQASISITPKNGTLKRIIEIRNEFNKKFSKMNQYLEFWAIGDKEYSGYIYCNRQFFETLIQDKFEWADYHVNIKENSWETWAQTKKVFHVHVFSESIKKLKNLKNEKR